MKPTHYILVTCKCKWVTFSLCGKIDPAGQFYFNLLSNENLTTWSYMMTCWFYHSQQKRYSFSFYSFLNMVNCFFGFFLNLRFFTQIYSHYVQFLKFSEKIFGQKSVSESYICLKKIFLRLIYVLQLRYFTNSLYFSIILNLNIAFTVWKCKKYTNTFLWQNWMFLITQFCCLQVQIRFCIPFHQLDIELLLDSFTC